VLGVVLGAPIAQAQEPAPARAEVAPAPEQQSQPAATPQTLPPDHVVHVAEGTPAPPASTAIPPTTPARHGFLEALVPEIHGFVSQGFLWSTDNNYLAHSERGTFEFTEVGINFTNQLTDRLRVGMQLFMRDLGPIGNYKPQFDWAYLDYRFFDWFGIRAGRTKIPFGLYNEVNDIDAARVPVLLPQSVYPTGNRDMLLAQTGGEVYGDIPLGPVGSVEYRAYGGTIYMDETDVATNIEVPFVVGGRVMWQTPLDGLRLGGTLQSVRMDFDTELDPATLAALVAAGVVPPDSDNFVHFQFPVTLWVASVEYAAHDLLLAAEYSQWDASLSADLPEIFAPYHVTNERFYVMASFRAASWFSPGAYYSYLAPDLADRSGVDGELHDVAVTARYDINDHWLVKLEGHYMHGTADLNPDLNDGVPAAALAPDWGLFLIKTTAYF